MLNESMLETYMRFPVPLAILLPEGRPDLLNIRFIERFGEGNLDVLATSRQVPDTQDTWLPIVIKTLDGKTTDTPARAIRTSHRILVMVDDHLDAQLRNELDALHARISALERLAATDHLTGAWNRAHLDRVIESEMARSVANRQPLSLVLFDIDHFKRINDTFGHAVGDSVLRELVRLVPAHIRASDILFRWGGEEFVVFASGAGYRRAGILAEKLRKAVAAHSFAGVGTVTISLGVAEHAGDEGARAWFVRMDEALYQAKESGRDRVVVARRGNSDEWAAATGTAALHLVWQEGYESGNETIDAEHRELFRLANNLIDAATPDDADPATVQTALAALLQHVQRHFADEETILEKLHYDQLGLHRRAHAGLLKRAQSLAEQLDGGRARLGQIVEFLAQDVAARHLLFMDRAFFPLFQKEPASTINVNHPEKQS